VEIYINKLNEHIKKFNILGKTVGNAEIWLKGFDSHELWRIPCFLLFKRLLIFRMRILEVLEYEENILDLKLWDQFIKTEEYQNYIEKIREENDNIRCTLEKIHPSAQKKMMRMKRDDVECFKKYITLDLNQKLDFPIFAYLWLHSKQIEGRITLAEKDKNLKRVRNLLSHLAEVIDSLIVIEMNFFEDIKDFFSLEDHVCALASEDVNVIKAYVKRKKEVLDLFRGKYIEKGLF
jgi:hypothetical protein